MSDPVPSEKGGVGGGRGRFTRKGVQLQQATDIETLKAGVMDIVTEADAFEAETNERLEALEGTTP